MPTHLKVIRTNDNSKTIYNAKLKETYHSINGAVTESIHVYINAGLKYFYNKNTGNKIKILEIGYMSMITVTLYYQYFIMENQVSHIIFLQIMKLTKENGIAVWRIPKMD